MGEVIQFKKKKPKDKFKGRELCKSGFHKWEIVQAQQFDVKQGRLVTKYRCARCGQEKVEGK